MNQATGSQARVAFFLAVLMGAIVSGTVGKIQAQAEEDAKAPSFESLPPDTAEESGSSQATESPEPEDSVNKDNSPYDYESSEEISEDRSVSFPVDI